MPIKTLYALVVILACFPFTAFAESTPLISNNLSVIKTSQLYAWCIVPYDAKQRNAEQRATMLKSLGIKRFAYDWRTEHLASIEEELDTMAKHGIAMQAMWFWIDSPDYTQKLDGYAERILQAVEKRKLSTEYWVSFQPRLLKGLSEQEKIERTSKTIALLAKRAKKTNSKVGLYNHGDWFGDPRNQIKIIEKLKMDNIGIVYNFHHAHQQIDHLHDIFTKMAPYLLAVNLNGVTVGGPKILPIGQGKEEGKMLAMLKKVGYDGPYGIIGHVAEADAQTVLQANITGLKSLAN